VKPGSEQWSSYVEAPLVLAGAADSVKWDRTADVVVVGFGAAGAAAAIEARDRGASVIATDRFEGGGASKLSGGVYYAGATCYQREAGYSDTCEDMYQYLKKEVGEVVSSDTLRAYCETSAPNLEWLKSLGVKYSSALCTEKVHYPGEGEYLYYSGNELVPEYRVGERPPPRGHRAVGPGFGGQHMYAALEKAALDRGVELLRHSPVVRLVTGARGEVVGVEVLRLSADQSVLSAHRRKIEKVNSFLRWLPPIALRIGTQIRKLEERVRSRELICARKGVILAAGSYIWNRSMVRHYAPRYANAHPNGTLGCDGSGIRLGESVGGMPANMDHIAAYRILMPQNVAFTGLAVNGSGFRFIAEDVYAAKLGREITEKQGGKAWLILDHAQFKAAREQMWPGKGRSWFFQVMPLFMNLVVFMRKGRTMEALARRCGIDPVNLERTVTSYNTCVLKGEDPFGKRKSFLRQIGAPPYYAIDLRVDNPAYPCITLAMGGLRVDERTGKVIRADGSLITGLYAAGRTALGIPSNDYVSGMAIGDCVFSGRRAGASATASGTANADHDARWIGLPGRHENPIRVAT